MAGETEKSHLDAAASQPVKRDTPKRVSVVLIVSGVVIFIVIALALGLGLGLGLRHANSSTATSSSPSAGPSSSPTGAPQGTPVPGSASPLEDWRLDTSEYVLDPTWNLNAPPTTRYYNFTISEGVGWPDGTDQA